MPTQTASTILRVAAALPVRLLRALVRRRAPGIADLGDEQLADIGLLPSDRPRRGWGGAVEAGIAARFGCGGRP